MAMTITEVRLVKYNSKVGPNGESHDLKFEVDFTGVYEPGTAKNLTTFTPLYMTDPMDIGGNLELYPDSSVYPGERQIEVERIADGDSPGTFTITVPFTEGTPRVENPNDRKDQPTFRRDAVTAPVARDRLGRLVATYASVPDGPFVFGGEKVLEVFATLPQIPVGGFSIGITGYRSDPMIAFENYAINGPPSNDPTKQQQWTPVNNAAVTIKGKTFPRGTLGLLSASASPQIINGYETWFHNWNFAIKPTFNLTALNAGTVAWDPTKPAGYERQRIRGKDAMVPPGPVPLDKNGKPLDDGFAPNQACWLRFETTREINFATEFAFRF